MGVDLTFINKDLNMAFLYACISLQNVKCLKLKNKYTGHLSKKVFGHFMWFQTLSFP